MKLTDHWKSTSRVPDYTKGKIYLQATFDDLETVVLEKNDALYGDAFNDQINVDINNDSSLCKTGG